jgi:hypothetical protein
MLDQLFLPLLSLFFDGYTLLIINPRATLPGSNFQQEYRDIVKCRPV